MHGWGQVCGDEDSELLIQAGCFDLASRNRSGASAQLFGLTAFYRATGTWTLAMLREDVVTP